MKKCNDSTRCYIKKLFEAAILASCLGLFIHPSNVKFFGYDPMWFVFALEEYEPVGAISQIGLNIADLEDTPVENLPIETSQNSETMLGSAPETIELEATISQPAVSSSSQVPSDTLSDEVVVQPVETTTYTYIPIIPMEQKITVVRDRAQELSLLWLFSSDLNIPQDTNLETENYTVHIKADTVISTVWESTLQQGAIQDLSPLDASVDPDAVIDLGWEYGHKWLVTFSTPIEIKIPVEFDDETPILVTIEEPTSDESIDTNVANTTPEDAGKWISTDWEQCDSNSSSTYSNQLITFANQWYVSLYSCGEYVR